jgi:hypothetical protein
MFKVIGGDQREYGPSSAQELRAWIADGRLSGESLAQIEGTGQWRPLSAYPEFADALRAQARSAPSGSAAAPPPLPDAGGGVADILARPPQVRVGACLAGGARLLADNFLLLFGVVFPVWALQMLCEGGFNPLAVLTGLLYVILWGVFYGWLCLIFLNRIRGRPAGVDDAFGNVGLAFAQLFLVGFLSRLLSGIGLCCLVLPGIYLLVAWLFSVPLVADKRLEFWSAMELSRKVVTRVWWQVLALFVLAFLPTLALHLLIQVKVFIATQHIIHQGNLLNAPDLTRMLEIVRQSANQAAQAAHITPALQLASQLVFLLNLPFGLGVLLHAYENLFGARSAPAA